MSKYNRTYHLPFSPGATNDDRISNDISSLLNTKIIITEKLDGENCGIIKEGVYARSHSTFTTSNWTKEVRQIHSLIQNNLDKGVYLFGENMEGIHSIEYSNLTSYFYLFGIRENEIWLSWKEIEEYAYILDLKTVPVLFKGIIKTEKELKELIEDLIKKPSNLGGDLEGVVVRKYDEFLNEDFKKYVMKWVRKNHVQTDEHWTKNWRKAKINYE
jgi:hypothetical protein